MQNIYKISLFLIQTFLRTKSVVCNLGFFVLELKRLSVKTVRHSKEKQFIIRRDNNY